MTTQSTPIRPARTPRSARPKGPSRPEPRRPIPLVGGLVVAALATAAIFLTLVLSGQDATGPSGDTEQPFISQVPPGIDGSDWHLYQLAHDRPGDHPSLGRQVPPGTDGSDRHLYELGNR